MNASRTSRLTAAALLLAIAVPLASAQQLPVDGGPAAEGAGSSASRSDTPVAPASPMTNRPLLSSMDPAAKVLGDVPHPDAQQRQTFDRLVGGIVDPQNTLDLIVGRPRLMQLKQPPRRVQIPDNSIASYDVLSDGEMSVTGKATGSTVLNLWFADPSAPGGMTLLSYLVRVFPDPQSGARLERVYAALQDQINAAFPDAKITLTTVGDNLLVRGEVKTSNDVTQILRILTESVPGAIADIPADGDASTGASVGASAVTPPGLRSYIGSGSTFVPGGGGGGGGGGNGRGGGGNGQGRQGGSGSPRIINLLRVPGENQVMLKVTVAEVNRSAARSIGLNFGVNNAAGTTVFQDLTGGLGTAVTSTSANLPMILDRGQVNVALQALRTLSLARSLAEPNLVAIDGQTASFQAGGQFPVPIVTGATATGLQGVTFVPFGVQLAFTPYITDRDRIRLVLAGDVSTRDASLGTVINGASVSGVDTRNFQTTVDLKPGQSLAIAGLIQQNFGGSSNHVPFFGDLPILSALLGTNSTSDAEQELVVLVSANLVTPMEGDQVPPLPGSDIYEPDDVEFFLGGKLESNHPREFRSPLGSDFGRLARLEYLQHQLVIGPSGYADETVADSAGTAAEAKASKNNVGDAAGSSGAVRR